MIFRRLDIATILLGCSLVACSGGSEGTNANAAPDTASNVSVTDMGMDGTTIPDAQSDAPVLPDISFDRGEGNYPIVPETEPNDQQESAVGVTQDSVLTGHVNIDDDLFDWWDMTLPGPSILRITVRSGQVGWIEVQTSQASKRGLRGGPGSSREFFIPRSDRYQIGVLATEDNPDVEYEIEVTSHEIEPAPLSGLTAMGDISDGNVDVYRWTAPGEGFTVVEVFGQRPPIQSEIDPFLFVYDETLNSYEWNDDAAAGGTKDSRLDFDRRDAADYIIAVDVYEPSQDQRYELRITTN